MSLPERHFSILRIKRKRAEQPLDALFVENTQAPSKKARKNAALAQGPGVFRFAATVELASFDDKVETKRLEDRISTLARSSASSRASPINATFAKEQRQAKYKTSSAQARYRVIQDRRQSFDRSGSEDDGPLSGGREGYSRGLGRSRPPKTPFARIWDAVAEAYTSVPRSQLRAANDTDMDTFNDMLAEYLKVSDRVQDAANPAHAPSTGGTTTESDDEESYVYDVYFQARAPASTEETGESYGTLSGLKMSDLVDDLSGESDSERALSDDEDSNEEDFYRNDYPEGEDSSDLSEEPPDPWEDGQDTESDDD